MVGSTCFLSAVAVGSVASRSSCCWSNTDHIYLSLPRTMQVVSMAKVIQFEPHLQKKERLKAAARLAEAHRRHINQILGEEHQLLGIDSSLPEAEDDNN